MVLQRACSAESQLLNLSFSKLCAAMASAVYAGQRKLSGAQFLWLLQRGSPAVLRRLPW